MEKSPEQGRAVVSPMSSQNAHGSLRGGLFLLLLFLVVVVVVLVLVVVAC
jgi:hypothetical protein